MSDLIINWGERRVQKGFRVGLRDVCERYGIREGDVVEIEIFVQKRIED